MDASRRNSIVFLVVMALAAVAVAIPMVIAYQHTGDWTDLAWMALFALVYVLARTVTRAMKRRRQLPG